MRISQESIECLENFDWPGNIRELKNVIQRAALVCDTKEILPKHLPQRLVQSKKHAHTITFEVGTPLRIIEREMVLHALEVAKGNRKKAAELLGISRRAIYNKLKKHQIS
ncbi:MAG: helix-turn-helix domain-containing protein [Candidatus Glassbacteria bacterium]